MPGRYNLTHLDIEKADERTLIHRDYLAHCLRWSHVLSHAKLGMKILDLGCGPQMPLAQVLYVNRYKPLVYVGVDLRKAKPSVDVNFEWYHSPRDVTAWSTHENLMDEFAPEGWDMIVCLETLEHMPHEDGRRLLTNIQMSLREKTLVVLSTPTFNGEAAGNHTAVDGTPMEWDYADLALELERRFTVVDKFGTFASQRDLKEVMSDAEREVFSGLREYYDSNVLSLLLAPLHPSRSRNVVWDLRRKGA